jgi:hypothetical protein
LRLAGTKLALQPLVEGLCLLLYVFLNLCIRGIIDICM